MRRKLFLIRAIFFFTFIFSFFQAKADKEASLFQLDLNDSITTDISNFLPVIVFDSLHAEDLVPFSLPYTISYFKKEEPGRHKLKFEEDYDSVMIHDKLTRRSVYNIAISRPDLIEFYNLNQFDETLNTVEVIDVPLYVEGVNTPKDVWIMPYDLRASSAVDASKYPTILDRYFHPYPQTNASSCI